MKKNYYSFTFFVFIFINLNFLNAMQKDCLINPFEAVDLQVDFQFNGLHFLCYSGCQPKDLLDNYTIGNMVYCDKLKTDLRSLDSYRQTPFFWCLLAPNINFDLVLFLLDLGIPIGLGALKFDYSGAIDNILSYMDDSGNTLLHLAVVYNRLDLIRFFAKNNADFYIVNSEGRSVIDLINTSNELLYYHCVLVLAKYCKNVSLNHCFF